MHIHKSHTLFWRLFYFYFSYFLNIITICAFFPLSFSVHNLRKLKFFFFFLKLKKGIALVQIISQSFPSLRFKTEHPDPVQPCSLRPNQSPCHRPSHSQQGLISHKASAVKPSRGEWGSPHWHPQPPFSQGTRGQDRITCSAHTHMHAQTRTHTRTDTQKNEEASQGPNFQIIIVYNIEEVTESYMLLSPPTYPPGGFNCQSSPTFLSTSGQVWEQALSQARWLVFPWKYEYLKLKPLSSSLREHKLDKTGQVKLDASFACGE